MSQSVSQWTQECALVVSVTVSHTCNVSCDSAGEELMRSVGEGAGSSSVAVSVDAGGNKKLPAIGVS